MLNNQAYVTFTQILYVNGSNACISAYVNMSSPTLPSQKTKTLQTLLFKDRIIIFKGQFFWCGHPQKTGAALWCRRARCAGCTVCLSRVFETCNYMDAS